MGPTPTAGPSRQTTSTCPQLPGGLTARIANRRRPPARPPRGSPRPRLLRRPRGSALHPRQHRDRPHRQQSEYPRHGSFYLGTRLGCASVVSVTSVSSGVAFDFVFSVAPLVNYSTKP